MTTDALSPPWANFLSGPQGLSPQVTAAFMPARPPTLPCSFQGPFGCQGAVVLKHGAKHRADLGQTWPPSHSGLQESVPSSQEMPP